MITSTINVHVYLEILDNFLILSIENWFSDDDDEVVIQDDNASCYKAKVFKADLQKKHIKSMT